MPFCGGRQGGLPRDLLFLLCWLTSVQSHPSPPKKQRLSQQAGLLRALSINLLFCGTLRGSQNGSLFVFPGTVSASCALQWTHGCKNTMSKDSTKHRAISHQGTWLSNMPWLQFGCALTVEALYLTLFGAISNSANAEVDPAPAPSVILSPPSPCTGLPPAPRPVR